MPYIGHICIINFIYGMIFFHIWHIFVIYVSILHIWIAKTHVWHNFTSHIWFVTSYKRERIHIWLLKVHVWKSFPNAIKNRTYMIHMKSFFFIWIIYVLVFYICSVSFVIYEFESYIYDGFLKSYMVKYCHYMLWKIHIWIFFSYMSSNRT